jgi:hypothetical protein
LERGIHFALLLVTNWSGKNSALRRNSHFVSSGLTPIRRHLMPSSSVLVSHVASPNDAQSSMASPKLFIFRYLQKQISHLSPPSNFHNVIGNTHVPADVVKMSVKKP